MLDPGLGLLEDKDKGDGLLATRLDKPLDEEEDGGVASEELVALADFERPTASGATTGTESALLYTR